MQTPPEDKTAFKSPSPKSISQSSNSQLDENASNKEAKPNATVSNLLSSNNLPPLKFNAPDKTSSINLQMSSININNNPQQQPQLNLKTLRVKQTAFIFNKDNLFSKPNQLLFDTDDHLSELLDDQLSKHNNSDDSRQNSYFGRNISQQNDETPSPSSSTSSFATGEYSYDNLRPSSSSLNSSRPHWHRNNNNQQKTHKGGKITISPNQVYDFRESDLKDLGQIGHGEFGSVSKVLHIPSQTYMAVKRLGPTVGNQRERKKVLKELDFVLECHDLEYVVKFYGVKFNNEPADCLILMELMDTSLEKFYKFVYDVKNEEIPEEILGRVVCATVHALNDLKKKFNIIHRDVKPSNMLLNRQGAIKMCDFGISGKLVDSIAASRDAGCQLYMAPERIDPTRAAAPYDVRSDVWSLGITLYELSTGKFPYPQWKTIFDQLNLVVDSDPPRLESSRLSKDFCNFVNTCLTKDETQRPKYEALMQHPLFCKHENSNINVSEYVTPYILEMQAKNTEKMTRKR